MKKNYQLELDCILCAIKQGNRTPKLLLHACCGPCSSYVLEYLSEYFDIIIEYYNPSIFPTDEYNRRLNELSMLITRQTYSNSVNLIKAEYNHTYFLDLVKGHETEVEGSERCFLCYEDRLRHAALSAKKNNCDYFTTTLSISPHKNSEKLNELGFAIENEYGISYLPADFKKRNGFKRSLELSSQYGMYRQEYCGCEFSIK